MATMLSRQRNVKCNLALRAQKAHLEEGTTSEYSVTATRRCSIVLLLESIRTTAWSCDSDIHPLII
jgi:hypothetical protein